jgi:hypothetical protein
MHHVGDDIIEQPLVMRDDHERAVGRAQPVDALGHDLEGIDVEAGIGLIEHTQPRLQERHLQDLVALLLAAREPDIDPAAQHVPVDAELGRGLVHALEEFGGQEFGFAPLLALGIEGGAQEIEGGDARNLKRILEGEEHPLGGTLVGRQRKDVLAVEQHLALGDDVFGLAGQHVSKR